MDSVNEKDLKAPGAVEISPGRLSVLEGITGSRSRDFELPLHFEIAAIIICKKGVAKVVLNDYGTLLHPDEVLFIAPDSILEKFEDRSGDCEISIVMISGAERFRSVVIDRQLWDLIFRLRKHPVIRLDKKDKEFAFSYKQLTSTILRYQKDLPYSEQVLGSLADTFLFQLLNMVTARFSYQNRDQERIPGQRVFLQFLDELKADDGHTRSVEKMARRLCVSPKYLARVVKENSGMTPSQWMNEYTMRTTIQQLRHTDKSMKDIALSLNFPNASSFGTFFRRHAGLSPANYRRKTVEKKSPA